MDALQWMGAVRMRVNGCSAVNGCRQNESQWMLCSEWVPSEWESDKNITIIIHTTPSVNIWRRQKLRTRKKIKTSPLLRCFNFRPLLKYESFVHNSAFASEKQSCLIWIRREIRTNQAVFTSQNQFVAGFGCQRQQMNFIIDYRLYFGLKQQFKVKTF